MLKNFTFPNKILFYKNQRIIFKNYFSQLFFKTFTKHTLYIWFMFFQNIFIFICENNKIDPLIQQELGGLGRGKKKFK